MDSRIKELLFFSGRIILYALLMFLLNAIFLYDAHHVTSTGKFGENSGTEILQEIFLFLVGTVFVFLSIKDRELAPAANLIALFFFMAFIREFNNQIDYWFYLVIPLLLLLLWFGYRDRKKLLSSLHQFIRKPEIAWFVIGFLVTFVFSRLFGRSELWQALMENNYNRWVKNAAEEGIELLGYSFFVVSAIEMLISMLRNRKPTGK
jgi:hypothetical protein